MNKLKIGTKIFLGFLAIILLTSVMGGSAYYSLRTIMGDTEVQDLVSIPIMEDVNELNAHIKDSTANFLRTQAYNDPTFFVQSLEGLDKAKAVMNTLEQVINTYPVRSADFKAPVAALKVKLGEMLAHISELRDIQAKIDTDLAGVINFMASSFEALSTYTKMVRGIVSDDVDQGNIGEVKWLLDNLTFAETCRATMNDVYRYIWYARVNNSTVELKSANSAMGKLYDELVNVRIPAAKRPAAKQAIQQVTDALGNLQKIIAEFAALVDTQSSVMLAQKATVSEIYAEVEAAAAKAIKTTNEGNKYSLALIKQSTMIITILCVIVLIVSIFTAFKITRMITTPLKEVTEAFSILAQRNFQASFSSKIMERGDEMGVLVRDFDEICNALSDAINEIRGASENVATSAAEINQGNQDLSNRTQQQASAVEETASALEQMTGSVKNTAEHSQNASRLAGLTRTSANQGGEVVQKTVTAMQEVTESSKKINDIINVVNEIAFQTNLLALNAAVEAARAGEAGRGFAVVAGEVRNLAGRSAQAAKEIQTLITDSVNKVEQGNNLVAESGRLLSEIINNVQKVADTIDEINTASQEQATGIEEINKAMSQMDQGIQQNAALVEEVSAASDSLNSSAASTLSQVQQFTTRDSGRPVYKALPGA
ncbi:MAG: methyl-accepting chemotaxis protein [Desulfarculales bacterium]|jgi:methyl-accepting chemotaxis protein|nr:methyl-accepting chemotaxis protein [Desulfarculales bacterium]